jgi:hypothetical protein
MIDFSDSDSQNKAFFDYQQKEDENESTGGGYDDENEFEGATGGGYDDENEFEGATGGVDDDENEFEGSDLDNDEETKIDSKEIAESIVNELNRLSLAGGVDCWSLTITRQSN